MVKQLLETKLNGESFHCAAMKSKRNPSRKVAESDPDYYLHRNLGDVFGPFPLGKVDKTDRRRKWLQLTEAISAKVGTMQLGA